MPKQINKVKAKTPDVKAIAPFMWVWMIVTVLFILLLLPSALNSLKYNMADPAYLYRAFIDFSLILINILPICFIIARYQRKSVARFCLVRGLYLGWVSLSLMGQHDILGASQTGAMLGFIVTAFDFYGCYYFYSSEKAKNYFIEVARKKK